MKKHQVLTERQKEDLKRGIALADSGLQNLLWLLNNRGYITVGSCSGLSKDHQGRYSSSFITFLDIPKNQAVYEAARKAQMSTSKVNVHPFWHNSSYDTPAIEVEFRPITDRGTYREDTDEQTKKAWRRFQRYLLGS